MSDAQKEHFGELCYQQSIEDCNSRTNCSEISFSITNLIDASRDGSYNFYCIV